MGVHAKLARSMGVTGLVPFAARPGSYLALVLLIWLLAQVPSRRSRIKDAQADLTIVSLGEFGRRGAYPRRNGKTNDVDRLAADGRSGDGHIQSGYAIVFGTRRLHCRCKRRWPWTQRPRYRRRYCQPSLKSQWRSGRSFRA